VIGGTSLSGGAGSILGTAIGALTLGVVRQGLFFPPPLGLFLFVLLRRPRFVPPLLISFAPRLLLTLLFPFALPRLLFPVRPVRLTFVLPTLSSPGRLLRFDQPAFALPSQL